MRTINNRGAALNYVKWSPGEEVYCADKNAPGGGMAKLSDFVAQLKSAKDNDARRSIVNEYQAYEWTVQIDVHTLDVHGPSGGFYTFEHKLGQLDSCRMAIAEVRYLELQVAYVERSF